MLYVVSYNLRRAKGRYEELFKALESSRSWWHYLDSTWLVVTHESANQLTKRLSSSLNKEDSLLVMQVVGSSHDGWLPQEAWDWIKRNQSS